MNEIPWWPSLAAVQVRYGRDAARTIGEIAEDMNISRRTVEKAVEQMRLDGAPVVTCSAGVYLTTDAAELLASVEALRRRAIHQLVGVRALRKTARRYAKVRQLELAL